MLPAPQVLDPLRTTWHITWGTYGTRLHGGSRPTVDLTNNKFGEPFVGRDPARHLAETQCLRFPPVRLEPSQRVRVEAELPLICVRGGWTYRVAAAGVDHVHLLCDVPPEIHGEKVRRLAKRWLSQSLSANWPLPAEATWWAEQGSNKAIHDAAYLQNAYLYILRQRATKG